MSETIEPQACRADDGEPCDCPKHSSLPAMSKSREDHIQFEMNYCQHYRPQPGLDFSKYCQKGCDIRSIQIPKGGGKPCIGGHELAAPNAICPHWIRRTREMGEKRADAFADAMERMAVVMPVVSQWRTHPKPTRDRAEVIECPKCKGRLHLSQSSYNGHVHGHCETKDCVSWME